QLRTSRAIKKAQWRWRSGRTELQSHGLGPIVFSRTTTRDDLCLKMALLTARYGALDERELDAVLHAVQKYLRINREGAREVFSRAAMGYIGDMSPDSLRTYLRAIVRSQLTASTGGHIAQIVDEGDREAFTWCGNRRPNTAADEGREACKKREHIRLS